MELTDLRTGFRGYRKEEVARLIGEKDQRCACLEEELAALRARLAEKEKAEQEVSGEAISAALIRAEEMAAKTRTEARQEADALLEKARSEAGEAQEEAQRILEAAHREAQSILEEAGAQNAREAERLLADAREEAERVRREAEEEILEKKKEAVHVLAAATQRAEAETARLEEARSRMEAIRTCVREALGSVEALISRCEPLQEEAPAGTEAQEEVLSEPWTSALDLQEEL